MLDPLGKVMSIILQKKKKLRAEVNVQSKKFT